MRPWLASLLVALAATAATLGTLGPAPTGPGVTCDELYHVGLAGKPLVAALRNQGPAFFKLENVRRNFAWPEGGPPVQAPLGHWLLGWTHHLFDPEPDNPNVVSIAAARFAPALAFGLLIFLVGEWTRRRAGPLAGVTAAASTALMPRLFAHAHFAALDMLTTTTCIAALLAVTWAVRSTERTAPPPRPWVRFALAGIVWGLAMLTRLHGVLLLPPIALWLAWQCGLGRFLPWHKFTAERRKGLRLLWPAVWFLSGVATLILGWPWLWLDPARNLARYLLSGSGRHAVHAYYLGQTWADHDVPWHYPWAMFVWTVPLGLLALGACGWTAWLTGGRKHDHLLDGPARGDFGLMAAAGGFFLAVFAWPGVPVYDGVRLFLPVFPLWAVFVGLGAKWFDQCVLSRPMLGRRLPYTARLGVVAVVVLLQGIGLILYHPCQTSYYSLLAGGLRGAESLGLEVTYWGDAVSESLLAEAARRAPGQPLLYGPNLAPFQAPAVAMSSPSLAASETAIVGWDAARPETASECRYAIVYRRRADLGPIDMGVHGSQLVLEHRVRGVWVTRLVRLPGPDAPRRTEPVE